MTELSERDRRWWHREDAADEDIRAGEKLHAVIDHLEKQQDRKRAYRLLAAMYMGASTTRGLMVGDMSPGRSATTLSLNVTRNVCDAVTSRVFAKSEPKLAYVTEGGGPAKQKNALQLQRGVEGAFYQAGGPGKFTTLGRDGGVYGTGWLRPCADREQRKVTLVRYRPWEVLFDDEDTGIEDQRSLYTATYVDKYVLSHQAGTGVLAKHDPDEERSRKAEQVLRLSSDRNRDSDLGYRQVAEKVRVEEAWRRPSGTDAGDGRHVIAAGTAGEVTLLDEPWGGGPAGLPWDFTWFHWCEPLEGYRGQGLVELGADIQFQINKMIREIAKGNHLVTGFWAVEAGSKVVKAHIQNELSNILQYVGTPPQRIVPGIIAPEFYQHMIWLVGKSYEIAGINQQTAQAQKPAGLDSGEAQRVYADQQTETLVDKGKRFAEAIKTAGQLVTHKAKELAGEGVYEVRSMGKANADGFDVIDWKELDDPDGYELRVHDTSSLPGTPAGKLALANDMKNIGGFDTADVMELVGMPDIVQATSLKLSSRKLVEKQISTMLTTGEQELPNPFVNVDEATELLKAYYCMAEEKGVEDEYLECMRNYAVALQKLKATATPPPAPVMGPGGGLLGPGMAPPVALGAAPLPPGGPPMMPMPQGGP